MAGGGKVPSGGWVEAGGMVWKRGEISTSKVARGCAYVYVAYAAVKEPSLEMYDGA